MDGVIRAVMLHKIGTFCMVKAVKTMRDEKGE
jgi:hypothetical protein